MWKLIVVVGAILQDPSPMPGTTRHDERNALLIEKIRKHGLVMQHPREKSGGSTHTPGPPGGSTFFAVDASGVNQRCTLRLINNQSTTKTKSKTSQPNILGSPCRTISQGYWNYKWCHRAEVTQFHADRFGQIKQLWSLGKFIKAEGCSARAHHQHSCSLSPYSVCECH